MIINALNATKLSRASDLQYRKIKLDPGLTKLFANEQGMQPKKAPWFTAKISDDPMFIALSKLCKQMLTK